MPDACRGRKFGKAKVDKLDVSLTTTQDLISIGKALGDVSLQAAPRIGSSRSTY